MFDLGVANTQKVITISNSSNQKVSTKRGNMDNNIASERVKAKMSQEQLAYVLGVSSATIRRWEKNPGIIPSGKALAMADCFGCSLDYLFCRAEERLPTCTRTN